MTDKTLSAAEKFMQNGQKIMSGFMSQVQNCRQTQLDLLQQIVNENKHTQFGQKHRFDEMVTYQDYRSQVAVQDYDSLYPYIERHLYGETDQLVAGQPCYYATTSGSTGEPKYIPVTEAQRAGAHQGATMLWSYSLALNSPEAMQGKWVVIVSPAVEGHAPDGTPYGSTSGQYVKDLDPAIKEKYTIPYEVYEIADYDARYYCIMLLSLADQGVTLASSTNPSTLSLLCNKTDEMKDKLLSDLRMGTLDTDLDIPDEIRMLVEARLAPNPARVEYLRACIANDPENKLRPTHYWPELKVVATWTGGNSNIFIERMRAWYGDVAIKDLGYLASEIRGSIPLELNRGDGVLTIQDNFFEFIRVNDIDDPEAKTYLADELELGEQYYLFFTNKAGLYRYNINDIIQVTGFVGNTPTIVFVQKGKGITNITGEKIFEKQVITAVKAAEADAKLAVNFYHCHADLHANQYKLFTEFEEHSSEGAQVAFAEAFEFHLQKLNLEYKTKRASQRLLPSEVHRLKSGALERFKRERVASGVREAQFKTVPLAMNKDLLKSFEVDAVFDSVQLQESIA
ncbi:GH3 auxin-responsive promoter family protein [Pseudoalteromonas sp. T1lg65]|uniref:GH3 auxin-responsive promoter family protein n=1 Tax=Pseudoalteromonas sp. T1lg65 TaxID=2077101 RepID=UPI003F78FB53